MPSASDQKWYQPAETAPQQCVLMAYPNSTSDNSGNLLEDGQNEIISIANVVAQFEPVILFSSSETLEKAKTRAHSNVSVVCVKQTSHLSIRDFGPIFVRSHDVNLLQGVDFNFNYWGGKRAPSGNEHIAELATKHIIGRPALSAAIVAEGGGIEVDGEGTFMAAESAIINDNRNLGKTKEQIEDELSRLLGVQKFLWLAGEVDRETADCHTDALARFIRPGVILLSKPSPEGCGKYGSAYIDARERLSRATDAQGRQFVLYDCTEPDLGNLERVSD